MFERESRRVRAMEHRILIVGAGISGLTLGALLHQRGFRNVVIIEKATEYRRDGYVLSMFSLSRATRISRCLSRRLALTLPYATRQRRLPDTSLDSGATACGFSRAWVSTSK